MKLDNTPNPIYYEDHSDDTYFIVKLRSNITEELLNRCTVRVLNNVTQVYMDENEDTIQIVIYKDVNNIYKDVRKKLLSQLHQEQ